MNNQTKVTYTKEEIAKHVQVSAVVEQDLKRIISERLEHCGLYFQVFSRVKTPSSMARKFERKEYGQGRKIQDLIGLRITLYFDDDMQICRNIMETIFEVLDWSTSERKDEEFKAAKLNGVFRLPRYLKAEISPDTWEMSIDDTFEIQIKTMFFEGWHEIEHDMRYKGEEIWNDYGKFSRYLNSILATLELCDKSMVTLLEDLGHAMYKSGQWNPMIKSHFRLKMGETLLYPEVEQVLDEDRVNPDNLGKLIYKTPKSFLVEQLLRKNKNIPINVNTIVALLNDSKLHDDRLTAIFKKHDVYNDGKEELVAESRHYELKPLHRHIVFQMCAEVNGSRIKTDKPLTPELIFQRTADAIYKWVVKKYGSLFMDMPLETTSYHADILAYHVTVNYEPEHQKMNMHVRHMDMEVGGKIWFSEASLEKKPETGKMFLRLCNGYAEPDRDNGQDSTRNFFSYPGYYKAIVDNIGIRSGLNCMNRRRMMRIDQIPQMLAALEAPERKFPIVIIISREAENGMMDEEWLGQFRISDFIRAVWRYAHVFTIYESAGTELLKTLHIENPQVPQVYIFWPDGEMEQYGPEDVKNCSFGRHLESWGDARTYDLLRGGQAFYQKLVTALRDWNISASMWEGFQLEIMTEILK